MRRLWITRHKTVVACLAKMKVYIEDPEGDIQINGFSCRKLGELKNGRKASFRIDSGKARVFVVEDHLSRNLYNEFVEIPEGEEDVFLSGRNVLKPSSGNPFRFDGDAGAETLDNRKAVASKGKKLLIGALLTGIILGLILNVVILSRVMGGHSIAQERKAFAAEELRITLTENFEEASVPGYTACFSAGETAVFVLREDLEQMKPYGEPSLEVYGAMILANNGFEQTVRLEKEQELTTFDARILDPDSGETYYYYCGLFRSEEAYWMVQITTVAEEPEEMIPLFRQWLKSVSFGA